jgi:sugar phosphate permease
MVKSSLLASGILFIHMYPFDIRTYAATAPFTGLTTDKFGMKRGFVAACFGAGSTMLIMGNKKSLPIINFLGIVFFASESFSSSTSTGLFALFNSLNFIFQGFGTNGVSKINACWYAEDERPLFGGIFSMVTSIGLFINLIMGDFILNNYRFNFLFVITGCCILTLGVFVLFLVDTAPSDRWEADLLVTQKMLPNCNFVS